LNPEQVRILTVSEAFEAYGKEVLEYLTKHSIRATIDSRNQTLAKKVRDAQLSRVNYQVVVGKKEEETKGVAVRTRKNENLGTMALDAFLGMLLKEIEEKRA
jgi:threonyl-tRNA synthetase